MVYTFEPNNLTTETNYARQRFNHLLVFKAVIGARAGEQMVAHVDKKPTTDSTKSQLSRQDTRLLLVVCTELVNLCMKLTGKIDPAAAAMLAYVRDDIVAENKNELQ